MDIVFCFLTSFIEQRSCEGDSMSSQLTRYRPRKNGVHGLWLRADHPEAMKHQKSSDLQSISTESLDIDPYCSRFCFPDFDERHCLVSFFSLPLFLYSEDTVNFKYGVGKRLTFICFSCMFEHNVYILYFICMHTSPFAYMVINGYIYTSLYVFNPKFRKLTPI